MDRTEVGVVEEADEVYLARILELTVGVALEPEVLLEVLSDLAHKTRKGAFAKEELRGLLVAADLPEGDGARTVLVRLLDAAHRRGVLTRGLGGDGFARRLASDRRIHGASGNVSIKAICSAYGLVADAGPTGRDYLVNHKLWAKRPLTARLVVWGAKDAGNVLELYKLQLAETSEQQATLAREQGGLYLDVLHGAQVATVCVGGRTLGGFIGRGGSGIRTLQQSSHTRIYPHGVRSERTFSVYFHDSAGLDAVKRSIC